MARGAFPRIIEVVADWDEPSGVDAPEIARAGDLVTWLRTEFERAGLPYRPRPRHNVVGIWRSAGSGEDFATYAPKAFCQRRSRNLYDPALDAHPVPPTDNKHHATKSAECLQGKRNTPGRFKLVNPHCVGSPVSVFADSSFVPSRLVESGWGRGSVRAAVRRWRR